MIRRIFLEHPAAVDEGFFEHMAFAARFSGKLFLAAGAAAIHGVIPCLFEKTASTIIADLYAKTHNRGARGDVARPDPLGVQAGIQAGDQMEPPSTI